ncbi:PEP/pyruvate-binding domain-containing protein [Streptomyces himastatinicus]|uniref:PEP/pyruvate-binding domain-containing protein n=1 Tax=Streptomyces himastatinicus TaxID=998084 RepID=UPI0002E27D49|nr:PEP/pyruvate-binding domain-containing protein [Streptomyces himastatinicus]
MTGANTVLRLTGELGDGDRTAVGGKAVGLAALLRAGATIPDTWVVPVGAEPATDDLARLAAVAPRWAVRSSATVEDGAALSYAGMFRSELDVPAHDLATAIAAVRDSARSGRVAAYRERTASGPVLDVGMAVLLQPFRTPVRSGLWLGRGPGRGRLEWAHGSGDALVSGAVTPAWEEWTPEGPAGGSEPEPLTSGGLPVGAACVAVQNALGIPADLEFALLEDGLVWLQFQADDHRAGGVAAVRRRNATRRMGRTGRSSTTPRTPPGRPPPGRCGCATSTTPAGSRARCCSPSRPTRTGSR